MAELAASIAERGVLQPILVRPVDDGYELVAGERRWRAAQRAQLHEIPALIREFDEESRAEVALIENIQRENLNAIEEAEAYRQLISGYGHSQEVVGKLVGKSRSHVANLLRLLDLPEPVRLMLLRGDISMGHARAVATAPDPEALANEIVEGDLSVRQAEHLAQESAARAGQRYRPRLGAQRATAGRRRPGGAGAAVERPARAAGQGQPRQERRVGRAPLQHARPARPDLPAAERRTDLAPAAGGPRQRHQRFAQRRLVSQRAQHDLPLQRRYARCRLRQPLGRPARQEPLDQRFILPEQCLAH